MSVMPGGPYPDPRPPRWEPPRSVLLALAVSYAAMWLFVFWAIT